MTFVVRLHYANYLMCHLYGAESEFDFRTYPVLRLVFDEIESEMDGLSRRLRKSSQSASIQLEDDGADSDGKEKNDRLSTVVNNTCTALREFEKYVRDTMKSQNVDFDDA
jgi:hypothetical protein